MRTLLGSIALLFAALSGFGQGTVLYQNTAGVGKEKPIWGLGPNPWDSTLSWLNPRHRLGGSDFSAQLFWGAVGSTEADLKAVDGSLTGFKSSNLAGLINGTSKLPILGTYGGDKVTLQIRAWDNRGGTLTSWEHVWPLRYELAHGGSGLILNYELTGLDLEGVNHAGSGNLASAGLDSFALFIQVPEPSVIALACVGIGGVLLSRRSRVVSPWGRNSRTAERL